MIKGISFYVTGVLFAVIAFSCAEEKRQKIDLEGNWMVTLDSLDVGEAEQWWQSDHTNAVVAKFPGSLNENDLGNEISVETQWTGNMWNDSAWYKDDKMKEYRQKGNVKIPFWLSPNKVYYGPAWYQKEVNIPDDWEDQQISLFLERPHWETTVWVDDNQVGMQNTLGTPHVYKLSAQLTPGKHRITIRVDNRIKDIDVGRDAHSVSDNTQTNWNGIIGDIKLIKKPQIALEQVQLFPQVASNKVLIRGSVKSQEPISETLQLKANARHHQTDQSLPGIDHQITVDADGRFELTYDMGDDVKLWDEFSPNLYTMVLELHSQGGISKKEVSFGMRQFKVDGKRFSINGRPVFLRGTLECAIFPLTGYPPTNVVEWRRIFKIIKNHGLNHMRFHSWCPPKAAFMAADELGVYLQVEASAWTQIGNGEPIDQWIYQEAESIIEHYGNHPSFVMMAYGNEPHGKNYVEYLRGFVDHMKNLDDRRLYTSAAGWTYLENMDYFNHFEARIQRWAEGLTSVINAKPPQTVFDYDQKIGQIPMPYVSHEIGQWCVYPNFREMVKYTGLLKPKNFEIFQETLEANAMAHLADSFVLASGKLQTLCYKADIEAALRTKDMAGFQLLDLHDFPGQGTALVGMLDTFWDSKPYVTAEEIRRFNDVTVPLVRLEKRVFSNDEKLVAEVEVAHYGPEPLTQITPTWKLMNSNLDVFKEGTLATSDIPIGNGKNLGTINLELDHINDPIQLTLEVSVAGEANSWDIWVYPANNDPIDYEYDFLLVDKLTSPTIEYLENGGRVLLNISKGDVKPEKGGDIGVGFSSIFWNTSWTKGQKPHTLGILCDPKHPALAQFPTEYHSNWQWWDAMSHSNAIVLDEFPPDLDPIVRIIDDWFENRRTALIFEVNVGEGKLLISGIDLHTDLENRPEARQLLYSLSKYVGSEHFSPDITLKSQRVLDLFK
ncbi:MAG: sugar-binding domain-containing protein [Bacteroidota bacterium]